MPSVKNEFEELLNDINQLADDPNYMHGKYALVVHTLESADYQYGVRFAFCQECEHGLDYSPTSSNPRIVVQMESGRCWHESCFVEPKPADDPEEARRLIEEHRAKILERMGR